MYDTLPGGAGFSQQVGRLGISVFQRALSVLENCPDSCDRSCYRCLRSYKNKFEHDLLDRVIGASLLRSLLEDTAPKFDAERFRRSTTLLFQDLERQGLDGLKLERNKRISVPGVGEAVVPILATTEAGKRLVIALHDPLTPDEPPDELLREIKEYAPALPVALVDELVVRRNLPRATGDLIAKLGYG